jgi:uncharacterized protein RhaS with RHS repeats
MDDNLHRLTTERRIGTNSYSRVYSYDSVGNRTSMNNGGTVTNYTYNNLNQLTQTDVDGETDYTYDANGNLTTEGVE